VADKSHGECLTEETLTEYLEGGLDPAIKLASEVHLIACDECRIRLGFFMKLLNEEVGDEEAAAIETIAQRWNKSKYKMPRRTGTFPGWLFRCITIAAALAIAVVGVRIVMDRQAQPKSAGEIVQLLLSQNRPFESRLANEPHLPIIRTRGVEDPGVAYGLIAAEMTRLAADSHQMGRFYLLQKEFSRAMSYLEIAEREVGAGAAVHNDLGVAYMESDGLRLDQAGEEFRHAVEKDPLFAPAVFNLALFYERTNTPAKAVAEWKRYIQFDPNSDWGKEALRRLQALTH
jgi:tetratricopeptide (TPR) repeat protein